MEGSNSLFFLTGKYYSSSRENTLEETEEQLILDKMLTAQSVRKRIPSGK
jgi:hypothetical protein|tara:strand:+ start:37746 stop:37895 length:150 start_codon:yes stop_codon:yes gene_type:complete